MRFFSRRRILLALAGTLIAFLAVIGTIASYLGSNAFHSRVRQYIVEQIARKSGANVSLGDFHWSFLSERFVLDDLTLRGLEPAEEAPLAFIRRIEVGVNLRTLLEHRIDLSELTISRPEFHLLVQPDGQTNVPAPPKDAAPRSNGQRFQFSISVRSCKIVGGSAIVNEQHDNIDFSAQNLTADLIYFDRREVLQTHLQYDGVFDRTPNVDPAIPYTMTADVDYTRANIIAQKILVTSGRSKVVLQGRVDQVISNKVSGRLAYTADLQVPFLNYFFTDETFAGRADARGYMQFGNGYYQTQGNLASDAIDFDGWHATKFTAEYVYGFPERRLVLRKFKSAMLGGSTAGEISIVNLPGPTRINLDLNYRDINAADLVRAYPWDPKYRIFSDATGKLNGWFEGKFDRFDLTGHADLRSFNPPAIPDIVALPLDGALDYRLRPQEEQISNAGLRLYSTAVQADGLITESASDLKLNLASGDLKDLSFIYSDANGSGSFIGTLTGRIERPVFSGQFTLQNHKYRQWTIQSGAGNVRLDTAGENADLADVRVNQGESVLNINGSAALSGSPLDLRVQSNHIAAADLRPFVDRDISGVFSADLRITSLSPVVRLEGDARADNFGVGNETVGNTRAHLRYFEPVIELDQLTIQRNGSTLSGNVSFNRMTTALKFNLRAAAIDLQLLHRHGLPESVQGIVSQADLQGDGTASAPNIRGTASFQNLSVFGEIFPDSRADFSSAGPALTAALTASRDVNLKAQINTAVSGYPFTAQASFTQYPFARIAKFQRGTLTATGNASLSGTLTDLTRLRGDGKIETADVRIEGIDLRSSKAFTFDFDSTRLALSDVALSGQSTLVNVAGTVGLTGRAPLNLSVKGQVDLGLIGAEYPEYTSGGTVNVAVTLGGTIQAPDVQGSAMFNHASLSRAGVFAAIADLDGKVNFDRDRITVSDFVGQIGSGTLRAQGTALLQAGTVQNLNILIDAEGVRLRGHPAGLRSVVDGKLNLRGTLAAPQLDGSLQIQNLAYRSDFEDFLALFNETTLKTNATPLSNMRLSLHIEGGKNITIQNQLANVEARVDIDLKGTVSQPSITGHIEASGGTLTFQGNRYSVTRGNIDFVDPLRIRPVIDIEAESQIREYRVILSITGTGDKPKLALRSEPALPELEIVSLIAGGQTREEIATQMASRSLAGQTVPNSEQVFQSGAASILFDLLQQRVGNRLGLLNGSHVRIEPFQVGAESGGPGTRITLSQQVTRDLSITYSQDLSSNREQVVTIEYFVSRNTSIVASRDELGNLGLDVRHRIRIK
ncbi:MAG TPA: translocation/assembly module TamB domain-containing protein [Terriglobia bacterium]